MHKIRILGLAAIIALLGGFVLLNAQSIANASDQASIYGFTDTPEKEPTKEPPPPSPEPPHPQPTRVDPKPGPKPTKLATSPADLFTTAIPPTRTVKPNAGISKCLATVHYMVKFVCGYQKPLAAGGGEPSVKPGNYATAINIHNYLDSTECGVQRPALHYTINSKTIPPVFDESFFEIASASVLEINCNTIWSLTGIKSGAFIEGMLDLGFSEELPVVVVYTAEITDKMGFTGSGAGISIDVEYLSPFTQ